MKPLGGKGLVLIGLLCAVPLASGCASQKQLKDYQDEVRVLRQERGLLKKEKRSLQMQLESYEVALADASSRIIEQPQAVPTVYPELDSLGIDYGTRGGNMVISIPAEITFGSGKASLSSKGKAALNTVAETLLADFPNADFWIEGHTDNDPISKSKWASNRDLSVARALQVLHFLVEECGVPDESCVVAGHGQYMPIATNDSKANKSKNRRVEIVVHAPEG